jgi:hypothetical protein
LFLQRVNPCSFRLNERIRALHHNRNYPDVCCAPRWYVFMQGPGRFGGLRAPISVLE